MDTPLDLDELTRQTRRREFDDGLFEITLGGYLLLFGLLTAFFISDFGLRLYVTMILRYRELTILGLIALGGLLILILFGGRKLIEQIRMKFLWKDSGFVKPLRSSVNWTTSLGAVAIVLILIVGGTWLVVRGMLEPEGILRVIAGASGIGTGIVFLGMGLSLRLSRFIWVGFIGGLLSASILILPVSIPTSWLLVGVIWTILLFGSGAVGLQRAIKDSRKLIHE